MKSTSPTIVGQHQSSITLGYVIDEIKRRGNPKAVAGMARFGIQTGKAFGVSIPQLRDLAKKAGTLFDKTEFAVRKAHEWSKSKEEYVKRAGFVLMAELAVHDKKASDKTFLDFLPVIIREASDERNFVKKAVNWSLRQIGKRNTSLNAAALKTCAEIRDSDSKSRKWIAADALRELTSPPVRKKLASMKPQMSKR